MTGWTTYIRGLRYIGGELINGGKKMKEEGEKEIYAFPSEGWTPSYRGLTKREYFAAMAMQGILSSGQLNAESSYDDIAYDTVKMADALIDELGD